jgi:S1-C subfamily serine protease
MLALLLTVTLGEPIDVVESDDFPAETQRTAVTATVRIKNVGRNTEGSGVVIDNNKGVVHILTANHVVDKAERLEVQTFTRASYPKAEATFREAKVVAQSREQDLALVRLVTRDPVPASLPVCPPAAVPREKDFPALSVGCGAGKAPSCAAETVRGKKRVQRPGEKEAVSAWELARPPQGGRSGGPLLDVRGRVIGVCSGVGDGKGYYCHTEALHHFLKLNGLEFLYEAGGEK